MIQFIEDDHASYAHRTKENVRLADVTLAFAVDFETSGERLTRESAQKYQKGYYAIDIKQKNSIDDFLEKYGTELQQYHSFNIAGNGLARLKQYNITQQDCDETILYALRKLVNDYKVEITEIRSGGQSGADESGLKAALQLDIPAICLMPNRWRFNDGVKEIESEMLFKGRFEIVKEESVEKKHIKNIEELYTREEFAMAVKIRDTYSCGYAPVALCSAKRVSSGTFPNEENEFIEALRSEKRVSSCYESNGLRKEQFTLQMWYAIQVWNRVVATIREKTRKCCPSVKDAFTVEWENTKPFRTLHYTNFQGWDYNRITEELWQEIQKVADSGEIRVSAGTYYNCQDEIKIYDADVLPNTFLEPNPTATELRTFSWNEIRHLFVKVPLRVQELLHGANLNHKKCGNELNDKDLLPIMARPQVTFDEVKYAVEVLHCDVNDMYGNDCPNSQLWGLTALNMCFMCVGKKQRREFVEYLLSKGADVNFFGYGGHSVLDDAYYCEDYEMIQFLLEHGANPNYNGNLAEKFHIAVISQIRSNILYMVDADCVQSNKMKIFSSMIDTYDYEPTLKLQQALETRDLLLQHGAKMFVDEKQESLNWSRLFL